MELTGGTPVDFPHLGLSFGEVPTGIGFFGFEISFYGILIACGMAAGYLVSARQAKHTGQNAEFYLDFTLWAVVFSIIGARLYFVLFQWEEFSGDPLRILNLRTGGLAIYGGILAGIGTGAVFAKIKKIPFPLLADTASVGLLTGQIIGRWGNFFNKEAFGGYTDSLFAMRLPWEEAVRHMSAASAASLSRYVTDGSLQVHPTFLYESVWNLFVLAGLLLYTKHKAFDGEVFLLYLAGYGLGRLWIEGLRTDQLLIWHTGIPVSQLLSGVLVLVSAALILWKRISIKKR